MHAARPPSRAYGITAVTLFLLLWEYTARAGVVDALFLSPPTEIVLRVITLTADGSMLKHISISGREFLFGFLVSALLGVPVGILSGWYPKVAATLDPFLAALYSTPRIAFMPLLFVWLGVGINSKIAVVFLMAFFPIVLNTIAGVRDVSEELVELSRLYGGKSLDIFVSVALPSAVPFIATGMRLAVGQGLIGVFVAELYSANAGVGFLIASSGNLFHVTDVFAGVLVFAIAGIVLMSMMSRLEARFQGWRSRSR